MTPKHISTKENGHQCREHMAAKSINQAQYSTGRKE